MTERQAFARTLAAVIGLAVCAPLPALAQGSPARQCFRSHDFQGFRPTGDHGMNVRVGVSDVYHVEFAHACPQITYPQAMLITSTRGSDMICTGLDWDLRVGQNGQPGFAIPCIVSGQSKLTKDEVAALPKGQKP